MEKIKGKLRKYDRVYQAGSFVHCWAVCGRKEAVRRYREHQEEMRIREEVYRQNVLTEEEKARQRKTKFPREILFSVLVPVYNTPVKYLEDMIQSVKEQTYQNWELVLVDGSDDGVDRCPDGEMAGKSELSGESGTAGTDPTFLRPSSATGGGRRNASCPQSVTQVTVPLSHSVACGNEQQGEVGENDKTAAGRNEQQGSNENRGKGTGDSRIKCFRLEKNLGISGNTNECIRRARGEYLALLDHDDVLHPAALYENMKAICETGADFLYSDENSFHEEPKDAFLPHFKPDYAPDTLRGNNYICHFTVFKKELLEKAGGGFRSECDGSQDYDLVLRLTEVATKIHHIPKILYYWRAHKDSVAESVGAKPYVIEAAHRAIREHLKRVGLQGEVEDTRIPSIYRIRYEIEGEPLISILIPNKDHAEDLKRCIDSIREKSTWKNWEIIVIENNSEEPETFQYYEELEKGKEDKGSTGAGSNGQIRVIRYEGRFNYSKINNFGFRESRGEYILLLNNDTEVISPDWMQEMLMFAQRADVGAVGAMLYYPDGTIQHAGIGLGLLHLAGHYFRGFTKEDPGYMGRLCYAQDLSAVTAACMMVPRGVYEGLGGLDESYSVVFNDVDLCLRIRESGKLIVWTPFAELTHYESKSRGSDEDTKEKQAFFKEETRRFQGKWNGALTAGDPYYNVNLSRMTEDFRPRV